MALAVATVVSQRDVQHARLRSAQFSGLLGDGDENKKTIIAASRITIMIMVTKMMTVVIIKMEILPN